MSSFQDKLIAVRTMKDYSKLEDKLKELLPEAKKEEPEEWMKGQKNYRFVRQKEIISAGYKLVVGELYIGASTKRGNSRVCVYVKDAPENMTCWFFFSTGTSNYGKNFPDFLLPLDDIMILIGWLGIGGIFPKKSFPSDIKNLPLWSQNILDSLGLTDKGEQTNIKNLLMRFQTIKDLAFSVRCEFGWQGEKYKEVHTKMTEFIKEKYIDLLESITFKDFPKLKKALDEQALKLESQIINNRKTLKQSMAINRNTLREMMVMNSQKLKKSMKSRVKGKTRKKNSKHPKRRRSKSK